VFLVWMGKFIPRDGLSHPHPEHMIYTFLHILFHLDLCCLKPEINSATFFIAKQERNDMTFTNIVTSRLWTIVFTKIKSSDVRNYVFPLISAI